jgi:hypothetical protein
MFITSVFSGLAWVGVRRTGLRLDYEVPRDSACCLAALKAAALHLNLGVAGQLV